jgi:hypothetical protein
MRRIAMCIALLGILSVASVASATLVAFKDTTTTPGNTITYTLTFAGVPNGTATLTIANSANVSPVGGEVYVGAMVMHMDGGTPIDITSPGVPNATWLVADVNQNTGADVIGGGGHLVQSAIQGGFAGFYSTAVASTPGSFTGLLCVTCAPTTYTFTFNYTGASSGGTTPPIPFQAIYYDGTSYPQFDGILSQSFGGVIPPTVFVPEPGSLLLIGSGLSALAIWPCRARRSRDQR